MGIILRENYRTLGETGIQVSPICFGCASAFGRDLITDEQAVELFVSAYKYGINFFDTGHSYGNAEERIGKALKELAIDRGKIVISTKFGSRSVDGKIIHDVSTEWMKKSVDMSLTRMGIDYIDILLYIHGPRQEDLLDEKLLNCLNDFKSKGVVKAIGANSFNSERIKYIGDNKLLDVVMLDYNISKQFREPEIQALSEKGIGVVSGQAMAEGVFLNELYKIRSRRDLWYLMRTFGRKESRQLYFDSRKYKFLNKVKDYRASDIALKYVLDNPYIASASVGTCNLKHLENNVDALGITIPENVYKKIRGIATN